MYSEQGTRTSAKQRISGSLLHEGFHVGATTVREYLAELKRRGQEVFIPLEYRPGEVAQVDFFEVTVEVAGQRQAAREFLMRLPFSGKDFAWIYERCNQIAFLDGHVRAFQYFEGVVARGIYDNRRCGEAASGAGGAVDGSVSSARQPLPVRALLHAPRGGSRQRQCGGAGKGGAVAASEPDPPWREPGCDLQRVPRRFGRSGPFGRVPCRRSIHTPSILSVPAPIASPARVVPRSRGAAQAGTLPLARWKALIATIG